MKLNKKGFSLIELLLAITFTAIVVLAFVKMLLWSTSALESSIQKEQNVNLAKYYAKTIQVMNNYEWNWNWENFVLMSDWENISEYSIVSWNWKLKNVIWWNKTKAIGVEFEDKDTDYSLTIETNSLLTTNLTWKDINDFVQIWIWTDDIIAISWAYLTLYDWDWTTATFDIYKDDETFTNKYNWWFHYTWWIKNWVITWWTTSGIDFTNITKASVTFNVKANNSWIVYFDNLWIWDSIWGLWNFNKTISDKYQLLNTWDRWILTPSLTDDSYWFISDGTWEALWAIDFNTETRGYWTIVYLQNSLVWGNLDKKHSSIVYGQKFIVKTTFLNDKNFFTIIPVYTFE